MDRVTRKTIIKGTIKFIKEHPHVSADMKHFAINLNKVSERKMSYPDFETKIEVTDEDTLYATTRLQKGTGEAFCFLIFGNAFHAGGGYLIGARAQEESVARRTTLPVAFSNSGLTEPKKALKYPIPEFGGVYIRDITILRESEEYDCAFLPTGIVSNAIIGCAYKNPKIELRRGVTGESKDMRDYTMTRRIYERTERKLSAILEIALRNGEQNLVLGAIGCGAFRNPPYDIANIFKKLLNSEEFKNKFKQVVFAIPKSSRVRNYEVFKEVLGTTITTSSESKKEFIMKDDDFPALG